jgi:hypothetical protein
MNRKLDLLLAAQAATIAEMQDWSVHNQRRFKAEVERSQQQKTSNQANMN